MLSARSVHSLRHPVRSGNEQPQSVPRWLDQVFPAERGKRRVEEELRQVWEKEEVDHWRKILKLSLPLVVQIKQTDSIDRQDAVPRRQLSTPSCRRIGHHSSYEDAFDPQGSILEIPVKILRSKKCSNNFIQQLSYLDKKLK